MKPDIDFNNVHTLKEQVGVVNIV